MTTRLMARRHKVNPGRIPGQPGRTPKRARPSGSHDYVLGWSQGRLDARAGKAKMPKQRGGGKPPKKGCLVLLLALPALPTLTTLATLIATRS